MLENDAMLEAHVRFELEQWSGDRLSEALAEEIAALVKWLDSVRIGDVLDRERVDRAVQHYMCEAPVNDEAVAMVEQAVIAVHAAALEDDTKLSDLLRRDDYDQLVQAAIGMKSIRDAVTNQVTSSEVYSHLIAHVMYRGIKAYASSENIVARKVPGASSLMRFGQGALSSAAPNLEKSVDKQLTAFVSANIKESIRESKRYLDEVLDEEVLSQIADEVWSVNAGATVSDAAGLVSTETISELDECIREIWLNLRAAPILSELVGSVVDDFIARHGSQSVMEVLNQVGISEEWIVEQSRELVEPLFVRAAEDGYLEGRIRARLAAFYDSYDSTGV